MSCYLLNWLSCYINYILMRLQAADFAYLVLTRNDRLGYESIHGTFKIPGNGSYAIENCGEGCHVVIEKNGDNARHPPYDESNLINDDTQLPIEVFEYVGVSER